MIPFLQIYPLNSCKEVFLSHMPHLPCPPSSVIPSSKYIYFSRIGDHVHPLTKFILIPRQRISDESRREAETHNLHPIRFSHETRSIYFRTYKGLWNELSGPGWRSLYSYLLRVGRSGDQIPVGQDFPHASRPALGPTQLSLHWVWVLSPRKKNSQSMAFTTYPHLPLRLKKE